MGHCPGGSSGDPEVSMRLLGRRGSLCLVFPFSCLPCRRGLAERDQGQNSPASTFPGAGAENLGKDSKSCIPMQPVLRRSQDGGGRQRTAQGLQLWI